MAYSAVGNWPLPVPWATGERDGDAATATVNHPDVTPLPLDDEDLVQRAQAGETPAFERLYERHVHRIYALCLRMVTDRQRAEELTQDVFVRAWEKIPTFEFRSQFGTWLHRLGVNVILGDIRAAGRRHQRVGTVEDLSDFESEVKEAMPETRMDLERAIAALPEGAKEILILHDIEGYRYREIAELAGIAEGTVKSQLSRARRLVREALIT